MQNKNVLFLLLSLTLIVSVNLVDLGGECEDKVILKNDELLYDTYEDHTSAFHGPASCVSLHSDDETLCCYMKIRYRNRAADKKYTHKGCIEMKGSILNNLDDQIKQFEDNIKQKDSNIDKVDIDIDCNSKFIRITGLILLAFLL